MNTTTGKDTVTLLNGGNYMYWKTKVRAILIRDDLWKIMSSSKPEVISEAWRKLDNKAMALITLSVEDSQLLYIANCETASEMWEKLAKQYARSSFGSQLYLRRKLYGIRYTLPEAYSRLVTALEGRDEADLSVEYVTGKMLDEYQRRVENCGKSENGGFAYACR
ncbi:hypothetical protein M514_23441 [Trichuris suis]|uniref:DUF4219 domain-containing protein n=1 Tax=Trichuris suis TaxID=68888 RepID=A0A085N4M1_9BILA|nr:hypothetical protein M514_23441 [Trichuris suis]